MSRLHALLLCAFVAPAFANITRESEDNDRESRADGPVAAGITVSGSLSTRRDIDWLWFDVPSAGRIDLRLDHDSGRDFDWQLFSASGPAAAGGASRAIPETGSHVAGAASRYWLKITSYSGSGRWWLDVGFSPTGGAGDPRPTPPATLQRWLTGNPENADRSAQGGPALLLMGGNFDIDEAFVQHAYPIVNGGDIVVLRTAGSDGYNDYLYALATGALQPDSVETLRVDTRSKAESAYVAWAVRNAELVYFAGGDQSDYLNQWQDTALEAAVREAWARGAVIGGISAGLAIQGEHIYDPDGISAATSSEAIADPYRSSLRFARDFLGLPVLAGVITDSHFAQRDRMGRLLAFMARLREDGVAASIRGLGIDEDTALFIDASGRAVVEGDGAVYVIEETASTARVQVEVGRPLIYRDLRRIRLQAGQRYDFGSRAHEGSATPLSVDGRSTTPLSPMNPYP
jgi:cyanophycinase